MFEAYDDSKTTSKLKENKSQMTTNPSLLIKKSFESQSSLKFLEKLKANNQTEKEKLKIVQEPDEDSNEMNIYQNILGNLKSGSSKHFRDLVSDPSTENSHSLKQVKKPIAFLSSKESSKTNIKINVSDLAKKITFNIDKCFK